LGRYEEAVNAIEKAVEIDPNYGGGWYDKGTYLKLLGRTTEANAAFAKAKELGYTG
jgi:Flp pilus assembly protein TadD